MSEQRIEHDAPMLPAQAPAFRPSQETAVAAVEAHARAAIESRYVIALKRPRDLDDTRSALMRECSRPGFANSAIYRKPIGKGIEGLSIRFAEAAIGAMRNVYVETPAIFDDDNRRIVRVGVTDLESNVTYSRDVTVRKEVERKKLAKGEVAISQRTNSYGDTVYLRKATDDEIIDREGALISKALRTLALRVVPGWLQAECLEKCYATLRQEDAKDPDAAKRKLADAFAGMGVKPSDLKAYLGHDLEVCRPDELVELRALLTAMRDGETTWREATEWMRGEAPEAGSRTEQLKRDLQAGASKGEGAASSPPPASSGADDSGATPGEPRARSEPPAASGRKGGRGRKAGKKSPPPPPPGRKAQEQRPSRDPLAGDGFDEDEFSMMCQEAQDGGDLRDCGEVLEEGFALGLLDMARHAQLLQVMHDATTRVAKAKNP